MGIIGRVAWSTWVQNAAALFTLAAATAAWRATIQVTRSRKLEYRLRRTQDLKVIHGLISSLGQTGPADPTRAWQPVQLNMRAEIVVQFEPLSGCKELADAKIAEMSTEEYHGLLYKALEEVETAQRSVWMDLAIGHERWWYRVRHPFEMRRLRAEAYKAAE